ncbi:prepilin-type N-terminal cleavage/methylation domain-containing protein [Elusimicrobiota bacterium]
MVRALKRRSGGTLVEVMVALVIFSFMVLGLVEGYRIAAVLHRDLRYSVPLAVVGANMTQYLRPAFADSTWIDSPNVGSSSNRLVLFKGTDPEGNLLPGETGEWVQVWMIGKRLYYNKGQGLRARGHGGTGLLPEEVEVGTFSEYPQPFYRSADTPNSVSARLRFSLVKGAESEWIEDEILWNSTFTIQSPLAAP